MIWDHKYAGSNPATQKGEKQKMTNICTKKEAVAIKYAISLKDEVILDIIHKDIDVENIGQELWSVIKVLGVQDVDYDAAFGNYIYVTISTEHDTEDTWKLIYDLINQYV